ncbi:MAG: creatininase family protein [Pseudonocardiaceae bacterium]
MRVEHMTWREYQELLASRIVVLPIGAIDGHGPHLPLSTDTLVAQYMAHELESHLDVLVLPAVPYSQKTNPTSSGGEFPGVTDLRASTLTNIVLDLLRASYRHGARRFLILDSHMANVGTIRESVDLFIEGAPEARVMAAAWWDLVSEESRNAIAAETGVGRQDDHHAAMVETSLVMHVAPETVRHHLIGDDSIPRRARYLIRPVPDSLRTREGVVYSASRASAAIGERLMTEIVANLVKATKLELL